jgi:hypothetical protein
MKRETWLAAVVVCGAGIALGAFLPWVSLGVFSISGIAGDGIFAIGIGAAMIVAGVAGFSSSGWRAGLPVALLGVLAVGLAVFEWRNVSAMTTVLPGTGLLVIGLAGAIAALVLSVNTPPKPTTT